jgi:hypothetical protein
MLYYYSFEKKKYFVRNNIRSYSKGEKRKKLPEEMSSKYKIRVQNK